MHRRFPINNEKVLKSFDFRTFSSRFLDVCATILVEISGIEPLRSLMLRILLRN